MSEEKRKHYKVEDMRDFAVKVLMAGGYSKDYAEATAYALLEADKRGVYSHGIAGGTGLEEAVKKAGVTATVDCNAEYKIIETKYPTLLVIDANGAPGHITSYVAVKMLKDIARKYGMGKVYVNNANHFGAAGVWSELIAEDKDLEGIVTCTTAACVKPIGDDVEGIDYTKGAGSKNRIGTNPEAISVPHNDGIVTYDAANTRLAASLCFKAFKANQMIKIPGYMADENYKSTLDPKETIAINDKGGFVIKGSFFPLGSEGAGYKGASKMYMIEMDNALGGGPITCVELGSIGAGRRVSHTFFAQKVDFLYSREEALNRIRGLMKDYEENYFGPLSRWPGDRAKEAVKYALENGIPYSDGQVQTLKRAAEFVGLDFESILHPISFKEYPSEIFRK